MWRFTLASYHSGVSCFQQAVLATKKERLPVTWENVSNNMSCKGGEGYVKGFMENLFAVDHNLYEPGNLLAVIAAPTFVPTPTPVRTPPVFVSDAKIIVAVYMARNGNK